MRAEFRVVADIGERADVTDLDDAPLSAEAIDEVVSSLDLVLDRTSVEPQLQKVAASYLGSLRRRQPSRDEAAYQLKLIAHLVWNLGNAKPGSTKVELVKLLDDLNDDARPRLWSALMAHLTSPVQEPVAYLKRDDLDWHVVGDAAASAWQTTRGGDYPNLNLIYAIIDLGDVYEGLKGEPATWSRAEHEQRSRSGFGRFAAAFFGVVDPTLKPSAVSNATRVAVLSRKRLKTGT